MTKQAIAIIFLLLSAKLLPAQTCTNPGQTPVSAIRVCGTDIFGQTLVPVCGTSNIPVPCNDGTIYQNTDPFWYKLACYSSGTLGFIITPNNLNDNYNWQLFEITGRNPVDVFTDPSMFVACNWSGDPGETGASVDGLNLIVCGGPVQPLFSKMPDLVLGHEYLLMISNHDHTTNGFQTTFTDGTAGITDGTPNLLNARLSCDGTMIFVKLNKSISCNTLAADGSDFILSGGAGILSATSTSCNPGLETDTVLLTLSNTLPFGNYSLIVQNGTDGNTLMDHCNRFIDSGDRVQFAAAPLQPARLDSVKTLSCFPSSLQLYFQRPIHCTSISADGSDFIVTGPQNVTIAGVTFNCNTGGGSTSVIKLQFASSITAAGIYKVHLVAGSDGNTVFDECFREIPPGSSVSFTVKEPVSAVFSYSIQSSCRNDTLSFSHTGGNGATSWNWSFDNSSSSNLPNPVRIYPATGQHTVRLTVSNGSCADTTSQSIILDHKVIAAFDAPGQLCPQEAISFNNTSTGYVDNWKWDFGNGNFSNLQTPVSQHYPSNGRETIYTIKLTAFNSSLNCKDSVVHTVRVMSSCFIAVPAAFTPNGDGLNDWLYPLNALKADQLEFRVFNRVGQLVFDSRDWTKKWDGRINGVLQNSGMYVWLLSFVHHDTGEKIFMKGTSMLIR